MNKVELQQIMTTEGDERVVTYRGANITLTRNKASLNWEARFTFPCDSVMKANRGALAMEIGEKYPLVSSIAKGINSEDCLFILRANSAKDLIPTDLLVFNKHGEGKTYRTIEYVISTCQRVIDELITFTEANKINEEQQELRDKIASKIKEMYSLMSEINEDWDTIENTDFLEECYPFDYSFDEITLSVSEWVESVEENKGLK